jgi:pimeloyl-ACP methyl ester carboxylesterase
MMRRIAFPIFLALSVALNATNASATPIALQPASQASENALIERIRFTVDVEGEGRDIILIPGIASPRSVWDSTRDALKGNYRLHLVQIRGFGDAAGMNAEGPVLAPFVAELSQYIRTKILDKGRPAPVIIGHSLGGLSALMIGIDHAESASKLIIVDALPFIGPIFRINTVDAIRPQAQAIAAATRAQTPQADQAQDVDPGAYSQAGFLSKSAAGRTKVARWTRQSDSRVVAQALYDDMVTDVRPELGKIKVAVSVIYAEDAAVMPAGTADALYAVEYKNFPNPKMVKISDSRHFIMLDQPENFHVAVLQELQRD